MTGLLAPGLLPWTDPATGVVIEPGTWGVAHGSGWLGAQIRAAELRMTGDRQASWAGHAFGYVGWLRLRVGAAPEPCIVEAEWPKVRLSPVTAHRDAIWAAGQPLTAAQRAEGCHRLLGLVGMHYDPAVYPLFLLRSLHVAFSHDLGPLFRDPHWIICSGCVAVEQRSMGVNTTALQVAATSDPNLTSPADLLLWGLRAGSNVAEPALPLGWMHKPVPPW